MRCAHVGAGFAVISPGGGVQRVSRHKVKHCQRSGAGSLLSRALDDERSMTSARWRDPLGPLDAQHPASAAARVGTDARRRCPGRACPALRQSPSTRGCCSRWGRAAWPCVAAPHRSPQRDCNTADHTPHPRLSMRHHSAVNCQVTGQRSSLPLALSPPCVTRVARAAQKTRCACGVPLTVPPPARIPRLPTPKLPYPSHFWKHPFPLEPLHPHP